MNTEQGIKKSSHSKDVQTYYDNNTRIFLKLGKDGGTRNIHQALWAEGVTTQNEAVSYSNSLMLREFEELALRTDKENFRVLDLGCGVGSSIFYLAQHSQRNISFTGVTISPEQVAFAKRFASEEKLEDRCEFIAADFTKLPEIEPVDMAYSIEAFLHAPDAKAYFQEAARVVRPGGKLIIIDDTLTSLAMKNDLSVRGRKLIRRFREGWLAASLLPVPEIQRVAADAGFEMKAERNLTPLMDIGRPRDKMIGLMIFFFGKWMHKSTYFSSLTGGYSKQQCLKAGWVKYRFMAFERK